MTGGVVLAGGRSSRMGTAKAALEWHGSTLLRRVAGLVARGVDGPVVVVAAPGQELPDPPAGVEVARDESEGSGPLEGLAVGLAALGSRVDVAYVSSVDAPFLHPVFVRAVVAVLATGEPGADVALPVARGFPQPLAAAYSTRLAPLVRRLVDSGSRRPAHLFEACRVVRLDEAALLGDADLARLDPSLESLTNLNDPAEYAAARAAPPPAVVVEGAGTVRAATLGAAAEAADVRLGAGVRIGGEPVPADPELPLAAGDTVAFGDVV